MPIYRYLKVLFVHRQVCSSLFDKYLIPMKVDRQTNVAMREDTKIEKLKYLCNLKNIPSFAENIIRKHDSIEYRK